MTDDTLMMEPPPPPIIAEISAFIDRNTPSRLTLIKLRHLSNVSSATRERSGLPRPALFTAMSSRPNCFMVASIMRWQLASSATSTSSAAPPVSSSLQIAPAAASERSAITTCMPDRAIDLAQAAPMPEPPPVTMATRPDGDAVIWSFLAFDGGIFGRQLGEESVECGVHLPGMAEIDGMRTALDQRNAARIGNLLGDPLGALIGRRHVRQSVNRQYGHHDLVQPVIEFVERIDGTHGIVDLRGRQRFPVIAPIGGIDAGAENEVGQEGKLIRSRPPALPLLDDGLEGGGTLFRQLSGLARQLDDADESARCQDRGAPAEKAALAHSHVNGAIDAERVHQSQQIARRIPGGEMTARIGRVAVCPLIPGDAAPRLGEFLDLRREHRMIHE